MSPSIVLPLSVTTAVAWSSPSNAASVSPPWISIPFDSSSSWNQRPASSPKVRERATSSIITIAQSVPFDFSDAATSQPM